MSNKTLNVYSSIPEQYENAKRVSQQRKSEKHLSGSL